MLATAGADRSDFDSKFIRPHDAHACRVSAARDQQRARKSFVSSNQFDFNIIIIMYCVIIIIEWLCALLHFLAHQHPYYLRHPDINH